MKPDKTLRESDAKINRLKAQKASLETKIKDKKKTERMSRTRTLIQLGGLLSLTPIPQRFDLQLGDDLQLDLDKKDQSLMLLGLLITVSEQLPQAFSDEKKLELKLKAQHFMNHYASSK